jgi:hypothetical protein
MLSVEGSIPFARSNDFSVTASIGRRMMCSDVSYSIRESAVVAG